MMAVVKGFSQLLAGLPRGVWVAISRDDEGVLAYDPTLDEVMKKAKAAGEDDPILIVFLPRTLHYFFSFDATAQDPLFQLCSSPLRRLPEWTGCFPTPPRRHPWLMD
jgi:hypothetical protein